jgi:hypothetical protein
LRRIAHAAELRTLPRVCDYRFAEDGKRRTQCHGILLPLVAAKQNKINGYKHKKTAEKAHQRLCDDPVTLGRQGIIGDSHQRTTPTSPLTDQADSHVGSCQFHQRGHTNSPAGIHPRVAVIGQTRCPLEIRWKIIGNSPRSVA